MSHSPDFDSTIAARTAAERPRLIRLCAALTGDWDAAEDLAQETLIEAWRHRDRLVDTEGYAAWLSAIARNVCLRYSRTQGREYRRAARFADAQLTTSSHDDTLFERAELGEVLGHALLLLPAPTRTALLARYVEDLPVAEVASMLHMTKNAVAVRLHRGKSALRQALAHEFSDAAGLPTWRPTAIWCPYCGAQRLVIQEPTAEDASFWLRCPQCCSPVGAYFMRLHQQPHQHPFQIINAFGQNLRQDSLHRITCPFCGSTGQLHTSRSDGSVLQIGAWIVGRRCMCVPARCEMWLYHNEIGLYTPEGIRFWREQQRIRLLPDQLIETGGAPALVTRFESAVSRARLEIVTLRETCQVVQIEEVAA